MHENLVRTEWYITISILLLFLIINIINNISIEIKRERDMFFKPVFSLAKPLVQQGSKRGLLSLMSVRGMVTRAYPGEYPPASAFTFTCWGAYPLGTSLLNAWPSLTTPDWSTEYLTGSVKEYVGRWLLLAALVFTWNAFYVFCWVLKFRSNIHCYKMNDKISNKLPWQWLCRLSSDLSQSGQVRHRGTHWHQRGLVGS